MEQRMTNDVYRHILAQKRVEAVKGFYIHVLVYVLVIALLIAVNVATGASWWVHWPAIGWGIGIGAHALGVFGLGGWLGPKWEERKAKEFLNKGS